MIKNQYNKLQRMVREAKGVSQGVKKMMSCALRQYQNGVDPVRDAWGIEGLKTREEAKRLDNSACIVGAALCNQLATGKIPEFTYKYSSEVDFPQVAAKHFGVAEATVNSVVDGFDLGFPTTRAGRLARKISLALMPEEVDEEDDYDSPF